MLLSDSPLPPRWRGTDGILIILVLLAAVALTAWYRPGPGKNAVISVDGKTVASYPLAGEAQTVTVEGDLGPVTIRLEEGKIRITQSPCPHQLCVKQGAVQAAGQTIVCLPNRLVIEITGPDSGKTDGLAY
jgi:hypothetical protein